VARLVLIAGARGGGAAPGPATPVPAAPPAAGAVEDLYRRHAAAVLGRCRYLLRDPEAARDAAQDVFVRALRALPELRAAASPTVWLLRVATNHCLNLLRASRAAWREEIARMARGRTERGIEPDARELVRALLGAAPEEAQEVAVLYFVDEMTQAEIAAATGRSLPTVRKRLREFLAAARGALAEAWPDLDLPDAEELP
jgi:RNA polymerase sigma factor (sigma-70 family)